MKKEVITIMKNEKMQLKNNKRNYLSSFSCNHYSINYFSNSKHKFSNG